MVHWIINYKFNPYLNYFNSLDIYCNFKCIKIFLPFCHGSLEEKSFPKFSYIPSSFVEANSSFPSFSTLSSLSTKIWPNIPFNLEETLKKSCFSSFNIPSSLSDLPASVKKAYQSSCQFKRGRKCQIVLVLYTIITFNKKFLHGRWYFKTFWKLENSILPYYTIIETIVG